MNTSNIQPSLKQALSSIPNPLRDRLIRNYATLKNYSLEGQYDAIGHQAGKLAEVLLRILQQTLFGNHTPLKQSLSNFKNECEKLEKSPKSAGPEGLRILIPRALVFLYTLRNKRDFGHAGGEVDANEIDAFTAVRVSDWCMCELVRISHGLPLEDAQLICNAIAERRLPMVWNILDRKRILNTALTYGDQTLLLLYAEIEVGIPTEDLFEWTEHSNRANYRTHVLGKLHKARLIEWDKESEVAIISPLGIDKVEDSIL